MPHKGNPGESMLKPSQLAERLGCSKTHILNMIKAGALRPLRLGPKTFRFTESEVARFLEAGGRA